MTKRFYVAYIVEMVMASIGVIIAVVLNKDMIHTMFTIHDWKVAWREAFGCELDIAFIPSTCDYIAMIGGIAIFVMSCVCAVKAAYMIMEEE